MNLIIVSIVIIVNILTLPSLYRYIWKCKCIAGYVKEQFSNELNLDATIKRAIQQKCNNAVPRSTRQK